MKPICTLRNLWILTCTYCKWNKCGWMQFFQVYGSLLRSRSNSDPSFTRNIIHKHNMFDMECLQGWQVAQWTLSTSSCSSLLWSHNKANEGLWKSDFREAKCFPPPSPDIWPASKWTQEKFSEAQASSLQNPFFSLNGNLTKQEVHSKKEKQNLWSKNLLWTA